MVKLLCLYNPEGGTHMLRHMGMCRPNGLVFHQKSLDEGPILVKEIPRRGFLFTKTAKAKQTKKCKINRFWGRKTLKLVLICENFKKKKKKVKSTIFWGKKSLGMGKGFRPRVAHPVQKYFEYPPNTIWTRDDTAYL